MKKVGNQESRMKKEQAEDSWEQIAALCGAPVSGFYPLPVPPDTDSMWDPVLPRH